MRRYKDKGLQEFYERMVRVKNPADLATKRVWGAILDAFTQGFVGNPIPPRFNTRGTLTYVAFYAGRDSYQNYKREKKQ